MQTKQAQAADKGQSSNWEFIWDLTTPLCTETARYKASDLDGFFGMMIHMTSDVIHQLPTFPIQNSLK
jgi:hypothetical protein